MAKFSSRSAQVKQKMTILSEYEDSIVQAARMLVATGRRHWEYQTQYASGTTCWHDPESKRIEMIKYAPAVKATGKEID